MKGSRRKGARWHNVCTTKNIFHNQQRQKKQFIHGQNTRPFIRRRAPVVWRPRRKAGEHNRDRLIISTILNAIGLRVEVERMLSTGRIDIVAETQATIYVIELKLSKNGGRKAGIEQIINNQYLEPFKSSKRQVIGLAIELDDMGKGLVDWGFAPV